MFRLPILCFGERGARQGFGLIVAIVGASSIFEDGTGKRIWKDFLHKALDSGTIVPRPDPLVVGEELRSVQLGLDVQKRGVSASKVVITKSEFDRTRIPAR